MAVPVVAALVLVAAAGWWTLERIAATTSDVIASAAVGAASETFLELVRTSTEELAAILGSLADDGELTDAVASRDSRRLLAAAGPRFHELRLHHGLTHWNYWEPEQPGEPKALRNVIRLGTPTLRGDLVERETLARVAREKALVSGLELGYTGFVLRVLAPVRQGDRVVGYVELGRDVGTLLGEMKRRTGDDFALVLDKRRIDPRRWASARAARGERNDWADRDDLVLVRNPTLGDSVLAAAVLPDALPDGGKPLGVHREGARTFAHAAFPIHDAAGQKVGAVYVFRDVTAVAARARALRREGLAAVAFVVALAAAACGAAFEWLVVRGRRGQGEASVELDPRQSN
jgi:hypothetical protein